MNTLVEMALKGTIVMALAWAATLAMRRASARHLTWAAAMAALLAIPLLLRVPMATPVGARIESAVATAVTVTSRGAAPENRQSAWVMVWAAGAGLMLARFATGVALVLRKARCCQPSGQTGVWLCDVGTPMTFGAKILLPREAAAWPADRLQAVVAHERIHVARRDHWTHSLGQVALALYWFHPLAWVAARKMRLEREHACDDQVITGGIGAVEYAGHLVAVARDIRESAAAVAMAEKSNLESRLTAILSERVDRRPVSRGVVAAAVLLALAVTLPLAALRPVAQARTISGTVYDPSGAVVPGAKITISGAATGYQDGVDSGKDGRYAFPPVPAGTYTIEAQKRGFTLYTRRGLRVMDAWVRHDVFLGLGMVNEELNVVAQRIAGSATATPTMPASVRVGGLVQPAKLVNHVRPLYPEASRQSGVEGAVFLAAVIGIDGAPASVRVKSSPSDELAAAAVEAVKQWRYEPPLLNGKPVEIVTEITVNFRLAQ